MSERSSRNFPREMAHRWYANAGAYVAGGASVEGFGSLLFSNTPPSSGETAAKLGLTAVSIGAMIATNKEMEGHLNRKVNEVNPVEQSKDFIKKQMLKIKAAQMSFAGSGFLGSLATEHFSPGAKAAMALAGVALVLAGEEGLSRIGSSITHVMENPYSDPPDVKKIR